MGKMEQHLGNATTSTTFLHQLRDPWKSPRGTVLRIEALTLVAIALSFFVAAFGSCRRWSNRWIIKKGILAANALSLSLGTYSIGLMQSSSVKCKMYPIWAVLLLTLFGCVDSITSYSFDRISVLMKMVYQICLYCGYVLVIGISSTSEDFSNTAITMLSAITLIKAIHRSLAVLLPSRLRGFIKMIADYMENSRCWYSYNPGTMEGYSYVVHFPLDKSMTDSVPRSINKEVITLDRIWQCDSHVCRPDIKDVCLSLSLSFLLQRHFFGLKCAESAFSSTTDFFMHGLLEIRNGVINFDRTFKVIELELAFLYDIFWTSNAFLHYYESKASSFWAFASIIGICLVGAATAINGTSSTRIISGGTIVVETTNADLTITLVLLVATAFLQVLQLIRCWTSNWARVALACDCARNPNIAGRITPLLRLKVFLSKIYFFDKYLWKNRLGQYSLVESTTSRGCKLFSIPRVRIHRLYRILSRLLGLQYIEELILELWGKNTGDKIDLNDDVKKAIVYLIIRNQGLLSVKTIEMFSEVEWVFHHKYSDNISAVAESNWTPIILVWHTATCYIELVQKKSLRDDEWAKNSGHMEMFVTVSTVLSKYCACLVVSKPKLLPGSYLDTESWYVGVAHEAKMILHGDDKLEAMRSLESDTVRMGETRLFHMGVKLGKQLEGMPMDKRWKLLADIWVHLLLHAAQFSDNVEEHIVHLAQGGEFITHLWALLSHAGMRKQSQLDIERLS